MGDIYEYEFVFTTGWYLEAHIQFSEDRVIILGNRLFLSKSTGTGNPIVENKIDWNWHTNSRRLMSMEAKEFGDKLFNIKAFL